MIDHPFKLRALSSADRVGDARRAVMRDAADRIERLEWDLRVAEEATNSFHKDFLYAKLLCDRTIWWRNMFALLLAVAVVSVGVAVVLRYAGWMP